MFYNEYPEHELAVKPYRIPELSKSPVPLDIGFGFLLQFKPELVARM
jgi:hypothetical protein